MSLSISDLNAVTEIGDTDILHLRTVAGLDRKITGANFKAAFAPISVSSNIVLQAGKTYIVQGDYTLQLPSTVPSVGAQIEIYSLGFAKITQGNANDLISMKNRFDTTRGTSGYVQLVPYSHVILTFYGSQVYPADPIVKLTDPGTTPSGTGNHVCWSHSGIYFVVSGTSPFISIYKRTGDSIAYLSGQPDTQPAGQGFQCAFDPTDTYLAVAHGSSPYITIYKRNGDVFTKLADFATAGSQGIGIAWTADGNYVVHGGSTTSVNVYSHVGDTFSLDNLEVGHTTIQMVALSPEENLIVGPCNSSPFYECYAMSKDRKLSYTTGYYAFNPTPLAGYTGADFSPDGGHFISSGNIVGEYLMLWKRVGLSFQRVPLEWGTLFPVSTSFYRPYFSKSSKYILLGCNTSPYIILLKIGDQTAIKFSDPSTLPTGGLRGVAITDDEDYIGYTQSSSPYIGFYKMYGGVTTRAWDISIIKHQYSVDRIFV